jgi:hypothetical protein
MRPTAGKQVPTGGRRKVARLSLIGVVVVTIGVAVWVFVPVPDDRLTNPVADNPKAMNVKGGPGSTAGKSRVFAAGIPDGRKQTTTQGAITSSSAIPQPLQPPFGTPVSDVVAKLKADADAGVPTAACRVGAELARCWRNRELLSTRATTQGRLNALPADSEEARRTRVMDEELVAYTKKDTELCEGVSDELIDGGWRYLLNASLHGNAAAMEQFAIGPPLSPTQVMSSLAGWEAYRDYGPGFLHRSIENGSVRALYFAFFSAATGIGVGGQSLIPRDPYRAIVYGQAALPLVDAQSAQMIMNLMPELQRAAGGRAQAAVQEAGELRRRYFALSGRALVSTDLGRSAPERCLH